MQGGVPSREVWRCEDAGPQVILPCLLVKQGGPQLSAAERGVVRVSQPELWGPHVPHFNTGTVHQSRYIQGMVQAEAFDLKRNFLKIFSIFCRPIKKY